jgi:hypothetical protein
MKCTKLTVVVFCSLCLLLGGGAFAYWALRQAPDFYQLALAEDPEPAVRKQSAQSFVARTQQLAEKIQHDEPWSEEFTQTQVNSWLAEELYEKHPRWVPKGVSDPRVKLTEGVVHLGFRWEKDKWSGVVSLQLKPSLPEPNRLEIEIQSARAGLIPLPVESLVQQFSQRVRTDGWPVEWSHADGRDILTVNLENRTRNAPVLDLVEVQDGLIRLAGERQQTVLMADESSK